MLENNPDHALLGYADTVGVAPVGLQLFRSGTLLAVANSSRFALPAAIGNMTILAVISIHPVLVQTVRALFVSRSLSVAADDLTLYLTSYNNGQVQIILTSN
ncbi:hypothetical protein [Pseudomonas cerasi]|uniref:Uncharacterized protein n=1 Tax=Pseudomonas cerasi TaxID=1583341 RepID=A0A193SSU4_9PSED|nr:hypothetical protein [Pseudomonas cerasi]CZT30144.1 hypothetical protein PCPL58_3688 [Pseudomonas cerasi]SOS21865.1 hypothetical protein PL963_03778 [Pseudomonas cerasi]